MTAQPATPAHYCPACRTTTPAPEATAEALVRAGVDHRAECAGPRPGCPDPIECDHEAAAGQAQAELEKAQRQLARARERVAWAQADREQLRAELDRTRAELATAKACACYPDPLDHEDHCPTRAAAPPTT